jgi:hypothetical protein
MIFVVIEDPAFQLELDRLLPWGQRQRCVFLTPPCNILPAGAPVVIIHESHKDTGKLSDAKSTTIFFTTMEKVRHSTSDLVNFIQTNYATFGEVPNPNTGWV